jgi:hypothetical protein
MFIRVVNMPEKYPVYRVITESTILQGREEVRETGNHLKT